MYEVEILRSATPISKCFICSPIGEIFRARIRMFPSLITCCTIDWFSEWPDEALRSVAERFLGDIPDVDTTNTDLVKGEYKLASFFKSIIR